MNFLYRGFRGEIAYNVDTDMWDGEAHGVAYNAKFTECDSTFHETTEALKVSIDVWYDQQESLLTA